MTTEQIIIFFDAYYAHNSELVLSRFYLIRSEYRQLRDLQRYKQQSTKSSKRLPFILQYQEGETQAEGVSERGADENIWAYEGRANKGVEETT
jgi:hypothetical protein